MPENNPRIILHVGALKTASTYLQQRMRANLATLRQHRIYVPVLPVAAEMAGNAKLLTTALNGRATPMFQRAFPKIDMKNRSYFRTRICAKNTHCPFVNCFRALPPA
jgi:hypothetical protein